MREDETLPLPPKEARPSAARGSPSRYELLDQLARGGMGVVFRARDPELGRTLALKVLRPEHHNDPEMTRRFLEEARIAGRLQHPGVVPIHDIGRFSDGRPFFTMKLVEGRTLAELLAARASPAEGLAHFLGIFELVCQAIAFAHSQGILHRDVKPANVMVGAFGEVQVMDWGLAKEISAVESEPRARPADVETPPVGVSQTMAGSIVGTPAYMPPEQARGDALDERADVFGLGGVLCEILTGLPTYVLPRSMSAWLLNQDRDLGHAYRRLAECAADGELVSLARDCLAEPAAARPRDAGAVARRVTAYRAGVQERLRKAELERAAAEARADADAARARAGRLRLLLAVGALLVVSAAAAALVVAKQRQDAARQRVGELLDLAAVHAAAAEALQGNDAAPERWRQAQAALNQAGEALGRVWNPEGLRREVARRHDSIDAELLALRRDRDFAARLFDIRVRMDADLARTSPDPSYRAAFKDYGLDLDSAATADLAERVRGRPPALAREVVVALDGWGTELRRTGRRGDWRPLLRLAAAIDGDAWRNDLRRRLVEPPADPARLAPLTLADRPGGPAAALLLANLEAARSREQLRRHAGGADFASLPPANVLLLATALLGEGMVDEALRALRESQRHHPSDVWLNSALAALILSAQPNRRDEAIRYLTAARAARPEIGHALAHALADRGEVEEAAALLRELARLRPDVADHPACLGPMLARLGRLDEAEAALRRALAIDPGRAAVLVELAGLRAARGRPAEAEPLLRQAMKADPNSEAVRSSFASHLFNQGRFADSVPHLRWVRLTNPGNVNAHVMLGTALDRVGEVEESVQVFEQAMKRFPAQPNLPYYYGNVLSARGRLDQAMTMFRRAVSLDAGHPEAHCNIGSLLRESGDFAEAVKFMRRGHELGTARPGWMYPQSGGWVRECEALRDAAAALPGLLAGRRVPASADEVALAQRAAWLMRRHAACAGVTMVGDLHGLGQKVNREQAGLSAAAAGAGRAADGAGLSAAERLALRRAGLTWLTSNLRERHATGLAGRHWRADERLVGVRPPAALPAEERAAWDRFWREADR